MRRRVCLLAVGAVLTLAAGPASAATEIQLWHAMSGANTERIEAIADGFNQAQSDYKIVATFKGTYAEALTAGIAAFRAGDPPAILQVQEVATETFMVAKGAIRPVEDVMKEAGEPFDPKSYVPAIAGYYTAADGRMLSFPFNSSTPVLYYNKDLLKKAGLDPDKPPRTWEQVGEVTKKLRDAGVPCGYTTTWISWIQLETMAAVHGQEFAERQQRLRRPRRPAADRRSRCSSSISARWPTGRRPSSSTMAAATTNRRRSSSAASARCLQTLPPATPTSRPEPSSTGVSRRSPTGPR